MPSAKAQESIECPKCGCRRNYVVNTRVLEVPYQGKIITRIRRRRMCKNCNQGYYTTETIEPEGADDVAPSEAVVFNNLEVKELTEPRSPLAPVIAPGPARGDIVTQQAIEKLRNPFLDISPKEEAGDGPLRGPENGSLGKTPRPKPARS